jgi:hypothetical protein
MANSNYRQADVYCSNQDRFSHRLSIKRIQKTY